MSCNKITLIAARVAQDTAIRRCDKSRMKCIEIEYVSKTALQQPGGFELVVKRPPTDAEQSRREVAVVVRPLQRGGQSFSLGGEPLRIERG